MPPARFIQACPPTPLPLPSHPHVIPAVANLSRSVTAAPFFRECRPVLPLLFLFALLTLPLASALIITPHWGSFIPLVGGGLPLAIHPESNAVYVPGAQGVDAIPPAGGAAQAFRVSAAWPGALLQTGYCLDGNGSLLITLVNNTTPGAPEAPIYLLPLSPGVLDLGRPWAKMMTTALDCLAFNDVVYVNGLSGIVQLNRSTAQLTAWSALDCDEPRAMTLSPSGLLLAGCRGSNDMPSIVSVSAATGGPMQTYCTFPPSMNGSLVGSMVLDSQQRLFTTLLATELTTLVWLCPPGGGSAIVFASLAITLILPGLAFNAHADLFVAGFSFENPEHLQGTVWKVSHIGSACVLDRFGRCAALPAGACIITPPTNNTDLPLQGPCSSGYLLDGTSCSFMCAASGFSVFGPAYACSNGALSGGPQLCARCAPGSVFQQTRCEVCLPGTFTPITDASVCLNCTAGSFCAGNGTITPTPCAGGTYCPTGTATPLTCGEGTYCPQNSSAPTDCPRGYYCDDEGASQPTPCPAHTFSNEPGAISSSTCHFCQAGEHAFPQDGGATSCAPCPPLTFGSAPGVCTPCTSAGCTGAAECAAGYQGELCTECSSGFYQQGEVSTFLSCIPCPPVSGAVVALIVLVLLLLAAFLFALNSSRRAQSLLVPLGIAAANVQLISFLALVDLKWAGGSASFLRSSTSLVSLHFQGLSVESECLVTYATAFTTALSSPLTLGGMLGCMSVLTRCIRSAAWQQRIGRRMPAAASAFLSFLTLAYIELGWQALSPFDCTHVAGESRVREDVSLVCQSSEWWRYAGPAIAACVAYIAFIPLLMFLISRRPDASRLLGATFRSLVLNRRHWFVGQLLWRLSALLVLRFLLGHITVQIILFCALFLVRPTYMHFAQPYKEQQHVRQEYVHAALTAVVVLCGIVSYTASTQLSAPSQHALFICTIIAMCAQLIVALVCTWREWRAHSTKSHSVPADATGSSSDAGVNLAPSGSQSTTLVRYDSDIGSQDFSIFLKQSLLPAGSPTSSDPL